MAMSSDSSPTPKRRRIGDGYPSTEERAGAVTSSGGAATAAVSNEEDDDQAALLEAVKRQQQGEAGVQKTEGEIATAKFELEEKEKNDRAELSRKEEEARKELRRKEDEARKELERKLQEARKELERTQSAAREELEGKWKGARNEHKIWADSEREEPCGALEKVKEETEQIRRRLRKNGTIECDSLLVLGKDSISVVLTYLEVRDLARCETVSRTLRQLVQPLWTVIDQRLKYNKSQADEAKTRAYRYHLASSFAARIEPLVPSHSFSDDYHDNTERCTRCDAFPSRLVADPSPADYELFVRFSKNVGCESNSTLILEGFVPFKLPETRDEDNIFAFFNLADLDLCDWPEMRRFISLENTHSDWKPLALEVMSDLVLTIVAIEKDSEKVHLIAAASPIDDIDIDSSLVGTFQTSVRLPISPHEKCDIASTVPERIWLHFLWLDNHDAEVGRKFECEFGLEKHTSL